jgi:hypothetical protein
VMLLNTPGELYLKREQRTRRCGIYPQPLRLLHRRVEHLRFARLIDYRQAVRVLPGRDWFHQLQPRSDQVRDLPHVCGGIGESLIRRGSLGRE